MQKIDTPSGEVSIAFDGPPAADTLLVLAPGAGADMNHEFMTTIAAGLGDAGVRVCRFNFAYAERGRKAPDGQPVLEQTYSAVVNGLGMGTATRLFVGGKSMGGRIASHVVAAGMQVDGLVFLGYPLHPPGRPERLRAAHLGDIQAPMLFVEGTRDPFCPLATLEEVRSGLPGPTQVAVIDDGDHSFRVRKSSGRTTQDAWGEVIAAVSGWLAAL